MYIFFDNNIIVPIFYIVDIEAALNSQFKISHHSCINIYHWQPVIDIKK